MDGVQTHSSTSCNTSVKEAAFCPYLRRKANRAKSYFLMFGIWQSCFMCTWPKRPRFWEQFVIELSPEKTRQDHFPSREWLKGHCKWEQNAMSDWEFSWVLHVFALGHKQMMKTQSCIPITIAVIRTEREEAEVPPLSGPCPCWMTLLRDPQHTNLAFFVFCKTARLSPRLSSLFYSLFHSGFYVVRLSSSISELKQF